MSSEAPEMPIVISSQDVSDAETVEMYLISSISDSPCDDLTCHSPELFSSDFSYSSQSPDCFTPELFSSLNSSPESSPFHSPDLFSSHSTIQTSSNSSIEDSDIIPPSPPQQSKNIFTPILFSRCLRKPDESENASCFITSPPPQPSPITISSSPELHFNVNYSDSPPSLNRAPPESANSVHSSYNPSPDPDGLSLSFPSHHQSDEDLDFGDFS